MSPGDPKRMEFGNPPNISMEQYLQKARDLMNEAPSSNVLEHISKDGTMFKLNKSTGEFATGTADGVIQTFYKGGFKKDSASPLSDSLNYFQRTIKANP